LDKRVDVGQGLVGQSYQEQRTIYLKQIPQNYVSITSGLGGANPTAILIVPLKVNESVEGVMELASFKEYQPFEIEFVEKVGEIIASTISNARINTHTRKLLEESQQHSEELRAQEEEMRQNMEEMQATQEQLHRQTDEMRKMQENLEVERSMFHMLMEYLPDRITYKDKESKILRVNKAKAVRFKMSAEDMIGKTDYDFFSKEHADKAVSEEQELIRSGEPKLNIEEKAVTADGDVVWASTSRIPFKNDRGEIIGMFIITKDVTELRIANASIEDKEKVIQRLLGNMPVFRYTIDRDGIIRNFWKSDNLEGLPAMDNKSVKNILPEIHDLIQQEANGSDLIGKSIMDINEEKEIFTHYIFPDSALEGVFNGFAVRQ
jgi:PAS domain S-box-containing protein